MFNVTIALERYKKLIAREDPRGSVPAVLPLLAAKALYHNPNTVITPDNVRALGYAGGDTAIKYRKNAVITAIRAADKKTIDAARAAGEKNITLPRAAAKRPAVGSLRMMENLQRGLRAHYNNIDPRAAVNSGDADAVKRAFQTISDGADVAQAVCAALCQFIGRKLGDEIIVPRRIVKTKTAPAAGIVAVDERGKRITITAPFRVTDTRGAWYTVVLCEKITISKYGYRAAQTYLNDMRAYSVRANDIDPAKKYGADIPFTTPAAVAGNSAREYAKIAAVMKKIKLSPRECQVLELRVNGVSLRKMADILGVSEGNIKYITNSIKNKAKKSPAMRALLAIAKLSRASKIWDANDPITADDIAHYMDRHK